jgi:hypothetical protein
MVSVNRNSPLPTRINAHQHIFSQITAYPSYVNIIDKSIGPLVWRVAHSKTKQLRLYRLHVHVLIGK